LWKSKRDGGDFAGRKKTTCGELAIAASSENKKEEEEIGRILTEVTFDAV